jgi:hypothetical protein
MNVTTPVRPFVTRRDFGPAAYYVVRSPDGRVLSRLFVLVVFVPLVGGLSVSARAGLLGFDISVNFIP